MVRIYSMNPRTNKQIAQLANQLRMLQVDLADDGEASRQKHLRATIERTLNEVMPTEREAILKGLLQRFPAWHNHAHVHDTGKPDAGLSEQDRQDLNNPTFLIQRLVELADAMSTEQTRRLSQQLISSGLVKDLEYVWPHESIQKVRSVFDIDPDQTIDPERLLDLVEMLSKHVGSIEKVSWTIWRSVAPRSSLLRGEVITRTLSRYLAGDPQITRHQVSQELLRLRRLKASLITALGRASKLFTSRFVKRLSPQHIQSLVPKRLFAAHQESMCWRKYKELTEDLTDTAIEKEIEQAIAHYVQSLMTGVDHSQP